MLAVLEALDIDRVNLVGHDWGGWIGFLMCIREPDRFSKFLALGIPHPWQSLERGWRELPRFWYQLVILTPALGYGLHRTGHFVRLVLQGGTHDRATFTDEELAIFADNLAEPAHARACVNTYRTFVLREQLPLVRGQYESARLHTPTHLMVGDTDPVVQPSLIAGYESHADTMNVETVPDCGHFIVDEHPDLVTQRAKELFAD